MDLSSPEESSVNEGIAPEWCSLQCLLVDDVVQRIVATGQVATGILLAKLDTESSYRMVPVHPSNRALLGMHWEGEIFFNTRLPFGLRSAPKIFSAVEDTLQWSFCKNKVTWVEHYLYR